MNPYYQPRTTEDLSALVQELENDYAEAFADDAGDVALNDLWKEIRKIKEEIKRRMLQKRPAV